MKKVLFIDRDGTLIWEPSDTYQIDSFEKLKFLPGVFTWLGKIDGSLEWKPSVVGVSMNAYPWQPVVAKKRSDRQMNRFAGFMGLFGRACAANPSRA